MSDMTQPAANNPGDDGTIPYHQVYFGCCNRTVMTREDVAQPKYCPFCGRVGDGKQQEARALDDMLAKHPLPWAANSLIIRDANGKQVLHLGGSRDANGYTIDGYWLTELNKLLVSAANARQASQSSHASGEPTIRCRDCDSELMWEKTTDGYEVIHSCHAGKQAREMCDAAFQRGVLAGSAAMAEKAAQLRTIGQKFRDEHCAVGACGLCQEWDHSLEPPQDKQPQEFPCPKCGHMFFSAGTRLYHETHDCAAREPRASERK